MSAATFEPKAKSGGIFDDLAAGALLISLTQATADPLLAVNGRSPHVATLMRWTQQGIAGIRLETIRCGARRRTTTAAIRRFVEALTAQRGVSDA